MTTDDRRRRPAAGHAAPRGRIVAAGLSASMTVALIAVMARPRTEDVVLTVTQPTAAPASPAPTTTVSASPAPTTTVPPKVVVVIVDDTPANRGQAAAPARGAAAPPPTVAVPAPPTTLAARPAVTPTPAPPMTKTRAS